MSFEQDRSKLVEIFKIKHLQILNDLTPINDLIKNNEIEGKLIGLALTNIKTFLYRPRYFYAILNCIAANYGVEDFGLIKCNELKLAFEIIKTICFNLLKTNNGTKFAQECRLRRYTGQVEFLYELLDADLIDAILYEIGFRLNKKNDTFDYNLDNDEINSNKLLIEMAYDCYINYYFYDNLINFIENYLNNEYKIKCKPMHLIDYLLESEKVNHLNYNQIYYDLKLRNYLESIDGFKLIEPNKETKNEQTLEKQNRKQVIETPNVTNINPYSVLTILSDEQWSCASCTYLNEPEKTVCVLCFSAKNIPNATFL